MSEETTEKSVVVWYPRLVYTVPDVSEWASLCLLHDQVILCSFFCNADECREEQEAILPYWQMKPDYEERVAFINTIQFLAKQNIIQLITPDKFIQIPHVSVKVNRTNLPDGLSERFINFFETGPKKMRNAPAVMMVELYDLIEASISCFASKAFDYPLTTNDVNLQTANNKRVSTKILSEILAQSAICQFALPNIRAIHVEDLLEARNELKDELLEFRAGILKLTWLLHQQVQNKNDLDQIRHEANTLTNTIIKGSLISLENRMKQHKKKRIRRMLFGTGRVLVEATKLFLPSGAAEKMISGGKGLLQVATEIDSAKPPEDQVATYLYRLKGKLSAKS